MHDELASVLSAHCGGGWAVRELAGAGGSAFCSTWIARPTGAARSSPSLFVKTLPAARSAVLEAEADGLTALAVQPGIRVPALAGCWVESAHGLAVLAMEWLQFARTPGARFGQCLGTTLATLHGAQPTDGGGRFGWRRDNWIGGTPQRNDWSVERGLRGWIEFLAHERLGAMATRLAGAGAPPEVAAAVGRLVAALPRFFDDGHVPRPSLIHGDLWGGNWACLGTQTPVIFDPAVSVSDAEAELAMMELFGSPPAGFWPAYREAAPLATGYPRRRGLYQLYHLLNHALLFGGGYLRQSMAAIDSLLEEG